MKKTREYEYKMRVIAENPKQLNWWEVIYPIARVAQSVERSAVNRKVGGSNPPVSGIFAALSISSMR